MSSEARKLSYARPRTKKMHPVQFTDDRSESRSVSPTATASRSASQVAAHQVAKPEGAAAGAERVRRRPNPVIAVAGSSLLALSVSGLITYPIHDRSWAAWAWLGLTMALGPAFVVIADRLKR